jgi:hypothetical protein
MLAESSDAVRVIAKQSFHDMTRQPDMADVLSLSAIQLGFAAVAEANGSTMDLAYADGDLMIARCAPHSATAAKRSS